MPKLIFWVVAVPLIVHETVEFFWLPQRAAYFFREDGLADHQRRHQTQRTHRPVRPAGQAVVRSGTARVHARLSQRCHRAGGSLRRLRPEAQSESRLPLRRTADTPEFAVDAIAAWWCDHGQARYGDTPELLILADAGGSNSCWSRNWKRQVQEQLADRFGLSIAVCHYPTGASKWNPIEHRLFSEVSKSWAGVALVSFALMLELIEQTETSTGLAVKAKLVENVYEKGIRVSDEQMAALALEHHATCPRWNYTIRPRISGSNS